MMRPIFIGLFIALWVSAAGSQLRAEDIDQVYSKPSEAMSWGQIAGEFLGYRGFTRSYALIVGIDRYSGGYTPLPTGDDALRMRDFLVHEAGFDHVHVLTNGKATYQRIRDLMVDFFPNELGRNDRFLFYWSGHGDQRPNALGGSVGYLPLADSPPDRYSTMISMGDIQRWDALLPAQQALFLLDACFSGLAGSASQSVNRDLKIEELARPAHHLLTAGTAGEQTIAGDRWGGSIFTDSVIRAIRGDADSESSFPRDGVVSLNELVEFVTTRVAIERRAAGWSKSITPTLRDLRGEPGQFFFVTGEEKLSSLAKAGGLHQGEFEHGLPVMVMGADPKAAPAADPSDSAVWRGIRDSQDPEDFGTFLESYPESVFAPYARNRLARLQAPPEPAGPADDPQEAALPARQPLPPAKPERGDEDQAATRMAALDAYIQANKQSVGRQLARFWRENNSEQYQKGEILGWETLGVEEGDYLVRVEFFLQHRYQSPMSEWDTRVFRVRRSGDDLEFLAYAAAPG